MKKKELLISIGLCLIVSLSIYKISSCAEPTKAVNEQKTSELNKDFYQTSISEYKDFNQLVVKYFSIVISIVSGFIVGGLGLFFFLFSRTLSEIKKSLKEDADSVKKIYEETFKLLNKQAQTNQDIFNIRSEQLNTQIVELKELYNKVDEKFIEISKEKSIKEIIDGIKTKQTIMNSEKMSNEYIQEKNDLMDQLKNI